VNTLFYLEEEEWRGEQRISPPGNNFTTRGQISPLGQSLPIGVKVRMGLREFVKKIGQNLAQPMFGQN
jgi:hypothetical protein